MVKGVNYALFLVLFSLILLSSFASASIFSDMSNMFKENWKTQSSGNWKAPWIKGNKIDIQLAPAVRYPLSNFADLRITKSYILRSSSSTEEVLTNSKENAISLSSGESFEVYLEGEVTSTRKGNRVMVAFIIKEFSDLPFYPHSLNSVRELSACKTNEEFNCLSGTKFKLRIPISSFLSNIDSKRITQDYYTLIALQPEVQRNSAGNMDKWKTLSIYQIKLGKTDYPDLVVEDIAVLRNNVKVSKENGGNIKLTEGESLSLEIQVKNIGKGSYSGDIVLTSCPRVDYPGSSKTCDSIPPAYRNIPIINSLQSIDNLAPGQSSMFTIPFNLPSSLLGPSQGNMFLDYAVTLDTRLPSRPETTFIQELNSNNNLKEIDLKIVRNPNNFPSNKVFYIDKENIMVYQRNPNLGVLQTSSKPKVYCPSGVKNPTVFKINGYTNLNQEFTITANTINPGAVGTWKITNLKNIKIKACGTGQETNCFNQETGEYSAEYVLDDCYATTKGIFWDVDVSLAKEDSRIATNNNQEKNVKIKGITTTQVQSLASTNL